MKFGKNLSNQIEETLPEWRDKFLSYKDLKRRIKLFSVAERPAKRSKVADENAAGDIAPSSAAVEEEFVSLLEAELDKFNKFFIAKEEWYIIRQKDLQDRVTEAISWGSNELMKVRKEIVDFHGEMVLLENYSALNYTGLVKILKKYDKRTGALIRQPFIEKVLQQPFFTTDLLYKLVKECVAMLDHLFPCDNPSISAECDGENGVPKPAQSGETVPQSEEIKYMESLYMKSTVAALRSLKQIRSKSSTVSFFSLPPLQSTELEERLSNNVPVVEQVAK